MTVSIDTTVSTVSIDTTVSPEGGLRSPLAERQTAARCPYCGRPDAEGFQVLSRHDTAAGQTVWTRCACGSLQWRVRDAAGERVVTRGPATVGAGSRDG